MNPYAAPSADVHDAGSLDDAPQLVTKGYTIFAVIVTLGFLLPGGLIMLHFIRKAKELHDVGNPEAARDKLRTVTLAGVVSVLLGSVLIAAQFSN